MTCPCDGAHGAGLVRTWCDACSEWCTPAALCVRGERQRLFKDLVRARMALVEIASWPDGKPPRDERMFARLMLQTLANPSS